MVWEMLLLVNTQVGQDRAVTAEVVTQFRKYVWTIGSSSGDVAAD